MKLPNTALFLSAISQACVVRAETTPELINKALQDGLITASERLDLLAYWIYEPASLPAQYRGNTPSGGTAVVRALKQAVKRGEAGSEVLRLIGPHATSRRAGTYCGENDGANFECSTTFCFTYDTIGSGLSIEDYKTSMEVSYSGLIDSYGWPKPPLSSNNDLGGYPIQIANLGSDLYGYVTDSEGSYTDFIGDNPNTPGVTEIESYASCMVLNSNFTPEYFLESPQASLDGTTSHEYVHSIQFGIGDPGDYEDDMWWESVAAYIEDEFFDDGNSHYDYLWPSPDSCLGEFGSKYRNFLMFRHAAEHNGGTNTPGGGEDLIQKLWENIGQGQSGLVAWDNALQDFGTNLKDAFHEYAVAIALSKSCSGGFIAPYCFEEGDAYRAYAYFPDVEEDFSEVADVQYYGSINNTFSINLFDLPYNGDVYAVNVLNTDMKGSIRGSLLCDTGTTLDVIPLTSSPAGAGQSMYLSVFDTTDCSEWAMLVLTNEEQIEDDPDECAATSYKLTVSSCSADSDNDGVLDCDDVCIEDPDKSAPGACGCGATEEDSDNDGTPDCVDECPGSDKSEPGLCGCENEDTDQDGDGTPDCKDLCPANAEKTESAMSGGCK